MSGGNVKELDPVAFFGVRADDALTATSLATIGIQRQTLEIALMRNSNNTILFGNEVLDVEVLYVAGNLGATRMGVLVLYLVEVLTDNVQDKGFLG